MKSLNDSKITLLLVAFVTTLMLAAGSANADFTFGEPLNLRTVISILDPAKDTISCFSYDGLEMYIASGYDHHSDLCVLRRTSIDKDWGQLENLGPAVNSTNPNDDDSMPSISADGLTLYFHSTRPGGQGGQDIYMTTRATKNDPWGPPVNLGPKVNSSYDDVCPSIMPDGLELYFHSLRPGGYNKADIWVAKRATQSDPWVQPVNVGPRLNTAYSDRAPCISPDGLVLFFFSDRPGGYGGDDIWMTRRATPSAPWEAPVNLGPTVNGPGADVAPRISPDGRTLYFWTYRASTYDNLQAPILPVVDFNGDETVDINDLIILIERWGTDEPLCDIGPMPWGDGIVDVQDLIVLVENLFEGREEGVK